MVIREARQAAVAKLSQAGVTDVAPLEVLVLMKHIWNTDEIGLVMMGGDLAEESKLCELTGLLERRIQGEPIAYLCGKKEFMSLEFEVNSSVLIPRGDTECIVEQTIAMCRGKEQPRILDIGTGSGCIAICLAHSLPQACVTAVDCSQQALEVAKRNANYHKTSISFLKLDILKEEPIGTFDFIVSNPPYIPTDVTAGLAKDVRGYEPMSALDGGSDGLMFYRRIIPLAAQHLQPGGRLVLEIGWDQAEQVSNLIKEQPTFSAPTILFDLAGRSRGIYATKDKSERCEENEGILQKI